MHRLAFTEITFLLVLLMGVAEACRKSADCSLKINGADPLFAAEYDGKPNFNFRTTTPATGLFNRSHSKLLQLPQVIISLRCKPLEGGPIPVTVNSKFISKTMQTQPFKGVKVDMINGTLDGNQHAAGGESSCTACGCGHNNSQAAAVALLSFCGNFTVNFTSLTIQGVQLMNMGMQPRNDPIPPQISTVLLFGGSRQSPSSSPTVYIHTAKIVHNAAYNATLLMTGSSRVTINKMVCRGNLGQSGACLAATDSAAVQLNNSSLSSCTAVKGAGVFTSGNASVTITGSNISHCTSSDSGGAIYARDHAALTVHGSNLSNNHAAVKGGALAAYGDVSVKVYSSNFSINTASWSGGAVDADSIASNSQTDVEIRNSTFSHNRAANQDNTEGWGGALAASGSTKVNISSASSFHSNVAAQRGGAISADDNVVVQVHDSTFLSNNAIGTTPGAGGGALAAYCNVIASIEHCLFQGNGAGWSGGAVQYSVKSSSLSSLTVFNSTFSHNRAANQDNTKGWGGALAAYGDDSLPLMPVVKVSSSSFNSNKAAWSGGAVDATNHVQLQLIKNSFVDNSAVNWDISSGWGGAVAAFKSVFVSINDSSYFQGNYASQGGGAINAERGVTLKISDSTFVSNRAAGGTSSCSDTSKGWGGAVVVSNGSTAEVNSSLFQQNNATVAGGAFAVNDHISGLTGNLQTGEPPQHGDMSASIVKLVNCTFESNSAQEKGGAFSVLSSHFHVEGGTMHNNTCSGRAGQGGLLRVAGNSSKPFTVVFIKGTMLGSKADIGGAVWASCVDQTPEQPTPQQVISCGKAAAANSTPDGSPRPPGGHTPCHLQLSNVCIFNSSAFNGQDMWLENALLSVDLGGSNVLLNNSKVLRARGLCVMGDGNPDKTADKTCQMCPRNMYSIDPEQKSDCAPCPLHARCEGGPVVLAFSGFFNTVNKDNCTSLHISRCPNPQACNHLVNEIDVDAKLVGHHPYHVCWENTQKCSNDIDNDANWQSYSLALCETGYRGLLCGACQLNYGQTDPFTCSACLIDENKSINKKGIYCLLVVYTVIFVVMMWAITFLTMLDPLQNGIGPHHHQQQQRQQEPGVDSGDNLENAELELTDVLKALIMYSQYFAGMIVKLPVKWPEGVRQPILGLNEVWAKAFGSVASLDCLLQIHPELALDRTGSKAMINLLFPVLVFLLVLAGMVAWWAWLHKMKPALKALAVWLHGWGHGDGVGQAHAVLPPQPVRRLRKSVTATGDLMTATEIAVRHFSRARKLCASWSNRSKAFCRFTQHQKRWMVVLLLVTVFSFYPSIARIAVGTLKCIKVCNGQYWLVDVDKRCPTEIWKSAKPSEWPSHAIWAAAVGIPAAVIVAAVPLAVAILLVWAYHSERLHDPGFRGCFGFMYSDYNIKQVESSSSLNADVAADDKDVGHLHQYWPLRKALLQHVTLVWDAVIHVQTICLVYVSVCGMLLHEYYQTLALAAVFGGYLISVIWLRPFRVPSVQRLQGLSTLTLFVTCLIVLMFIPPDDMDDRQLSQYKHVQPVFGVLLLVLNISFFVYALSRLIGCCLRKRNWHCHAICGAVQHDDEQREYVLSCSVWQMHNQQQQHGVITEQDIAESSQGPDSVPPLQQQQTARHMQARQPFLMIRTGKRQVGCSMQLAEHHIDISADKSA